MAKRTSNPSAGQADLANSQAAGLLARMKGAHAEDDGSAVGQRPAPAAATLAVQRSDEERAEEHDARMQTPDGGPAIDPVAIRIDVLKEDIGDLVTAEDEVILYKYMRRRQRLEMERIRIAEQTAALLKSIENQVMGLDFVYEGQAREVVKKMIARQGGKAKSIKTPFGQAGFRVTGGGIQVIDEAKLIVHCDASQDQKVRACIKREPCISKSAVNEHFKLTAELLPGCEFGRGEEKFYVK